MVGIMFQREQNKLVKDCPLVQPGEAKQLDDEFHASRQVDTKETKPPVGGLTRLKTADMDATVLGLTVQASLLGSGADASSVSRGFISALHEQGQFVSVIKRETPKEFEPFGPGTVKLYEQAKFDKGVLHASAGPPVLQNLECWIDESDHTMALTVGRSVMVMLGYSTDGLLVLALSDGLPRQTSVVDDNLNQGHSYPRQKNVAEKNVEQVRDHLLRAIEDASQRGLRGEALNRLKTALEQHKADFCVIFGLYPPVGVPPLRVQLKPRVTPFPCSTRCYAPMERVFMDAHLAELDDLGRVYRNYSSRWASAPSVVPKPPPAAFRRSIDSRSVNDQTIGMRWPMPQLDVGIMRVAGAKVFFICVSFRGYWQLSLHPNSQEIFTFMTHCGMYTPTRVPMGTKGAVSYCQSVVELIFGDLVYRGVLVWLDDILCYAESEEELMELLEEVLQGCAKFGLKLNPAKCRPESVQGLVDMVSPTTATDLQQIVCVINWMRASISEFARVSAPLYDILEKAMQVSGERTKRKLRKVSLASVGWGEKEADCLANVKT
ncbi:unnamed protein product [Phytophthora fragariaefolia]|uniref:Unnamed protein product n=1 Tax=Phytophthora fragariaefolia TaxID=1490495 RepID=A0A9W7CW31_9STRA|nr:unnamed protein product [Phytophthora fragariaefolia]